MKKRMAGRILEGPQGGGKGPAGDLPGCYRRAGRDRALPLRRALVQAVSHDQPAVAQKLEPLDLVLSLPSGDQEGHLHHQCHRIHEPGTAQDHQDQGCLPHQRGRQETALPGPAQSVQKVDTAACQLVGRNLPVHHNVRGQCAHSMKQFVT